MGRDATDLPGFMRRLQPSEVDLATAWCEAIRKEDKLQTKAWQNNGAIGADVLSRPPPPPPPRRDEVLSFARGIEWRQALADPEAAEAMRKVRGRVATLLAQGRAALEFTPVAPDMATRMLNKRAGGPRHVQFRTSKLNPLEGVEIAKGWDPRARTWTGTQAFANLEPQPTSLWCEGWGQSANNAGLDFEFKYVKEKTVPSELHTRGWR